MIRKDLTRKYATAMVVLLSLYNTVNINTALALEIQIADGITTNTSSISDDNTILFTGESSGTLNHDNTTRSFANIATNNDGVGVLDITSTNFSSLTITGDIGSSTKNINNILFDQYIVLTVNGNIYAKNGIITSVDSQGDLNLDGTGIVVVGNVGDATSKLGQISVLSNSDATFYGDIFTNSLGVSSGGSATLNENSSTSSLSTSATGTLNIASGKQLTISNVATVNGTLGVAIDSSVSSTPSITSSADLTISNDATLSFNYSNSGHLKSGDSYNFITTTGTLTDNSSTVTDNSFLLAPTVVTNGVSLEVTQNIDSTSTTLLSASDNELVDFLIYNTQDNSDSDLAQTTILKMSSQSIVESALDNLSDTLQINENNLIQKTSSDISNAISSSIDDRLQFINYNQFTNFYKRKPRKKKVFLFKKYKNRRVKGVMPQTKHSGFWSKAFGGKSKMDGINNSTSEVKGYDVDFAGVSFGVDKIINGKKISSILGGALSYGGANGESKSLSNQKTNIESYNLSLYNHNIGKNGLGFFNDNILGIGYNQYDSSKIIKIDSSYQVKSEAEFSAMQYNAKIGFGYNFKIGERTILSPIASINYFGLQLQDYQEDNVGGLGLKVKNNSFNLLSSEVGFRIMGNISKIIKPQINVSWLSNLKTKGSKSTSASNDVNGNQYYANNSGSDIDRDVLKAGVQLDFTTSKNTSIALKYDLRKSTNFTSHLGSTNFVWIF